MAKIWSVLRLSLTTGGLIPQNADNIDHSLQKLPILNYQDPTYKGSARAIQSLYVCLGQMLKSDIYTHITPKLTAGGRYGGE
jgi:hypothetical protein